MTVTLQEVKATPSAKVANVIMQIEEAWEANDIDAIAVVLIDRKGAPTTAFASRMNNGLELLGATELLRCDVKEALE